MTKDTVQGYFDCLRRKNDWEKFLANGIAFTSFVSPIKQIVGKSAYLEATKRFFSMVTTVEIRDLIVDGSKACALTRYKLQPPAGPPFESNVAEIFEVRDGQIVSLHIYFDSAPFPKPPTAA
jgi:ketosteroid isomerase-like protein